MEAAWNSSPSLAASPLSRKSRRTGPRSFSRPVTSRLAVMSSIFSQRIGNHETTSDSPGVYDRRLARGRAAATAEEETAGDRIRGGVSARFSLKRPGHDVEARARYGVVGHLHPDRHPAHHQEKDSRRKRQEPGLL